MVVDEKILCGLMNKVYKHGGYTVYRSDANVLSISGKDWVVEINWERVPDKVIGIIAQHMRGLPEIGDAFTIKKDADQTVISAMAPRFPEIPDVAFGISRTLLAYGNYHIWQTTIGNVLMVNADESVMICETGRQCLYVGNGIAVIGTASKAFIKGAFFLEDDQHTIAAEKLAKTKWI